MRTQIRALARGTVGLCLLITLFGSASAMNEDTRKELCTFKERVAVPTNPRVMKFVNAMITEVPPETEVLVCVLVGDGDVAVTSEILRQESSRILVIWINDALLPLPAEPLFRYAIGRELLRYPDESGICDFESLPEYIPCELVLDRAVARRFSSKAETTVVLRAIVTALSAAGKRALLVRTVEARLLLFEKSDAQDTGSNGESNDRPTAEK